ncbi:hypothetical protein HBH92_062760 [Parastagonospora nodorum]|nr:hypothetical protein HBH50_081350 [Parastagonospora nodorum]KAH4094182.1 hypothetical protein HBH48_069600 [Parastagonospora nodorum]KAH4417120.1 hypothetical protein HBH92_062760 [Parastagonospora nodorum]KAH4424487.1 hypothetical protein HBH93_187560 [Parastagonospora nodorum]KAH4560963.1 hypothetical protein HBH86_070440 [Parastagonospora nodorum]
MPFLSRSLSTGSVDIVQPYLSCLLLCLCAVGILLTSLKNLRTNELYPDADYIGCYVANGGTAGSPELIGDYNGARTQLDPNGQRDCFYWCIFDAPDAPYNFIALENGINCLCANQTNPNVNAIKRDDSECNVVALGTTDEAGGGDNRITLFRVEGYEDPSEEPGDSPDTTTSTTDTTTSTTDTTTSTIATTTSTTATTTSTSATTTSRNVDDNDVNINLNHRNRDGNVDDHDLNINLSHRHRNRNVVNSHNDVKQHRYKQYRHVQHSTSRSTTGTSSTTQPSVLLRFGPDIFLKEEEEGGGIMTERTDGSRKEDWRYDAMEHEILVGTGYAGIQERVGSQEDW